MKTGVRKAMNANNKDIKAQELFVQILFSITLWAIYRFFVSKFEEGNSVTAQEIVNKAIYEGITQLAGTIKKRILDAI